MTPNLTVSWLATVWSTRSLCSPVSPGFFLCAETDQAFLRTAVFQLGSDPIQATSHAASIIGVLIDVKRFEQERPLIRAEMNGLSGRWVSHEWSLAVSVNGLYCSTRVKGMTLAPLQQAQT